ncbi:MAG TPA: hypothetical protein PL187_22100, partial [Caldilinea sp.]|nr:hypothetical protein [Caldilinea sp.]
MRKQVSFILSLLIVLSMVLSACTAAPVAPAAPAPDSAAGDAADATTQEVPAGATRVAFWHSMAGDIGGKSIPKL